MNLVFKNSILRVESSKFGSEFLTVIFVCIALNNHIIAEKTIVT